MPQLDGLRAIAVLIVLAGHIAHVPGAFVGVVVFFALSGFLITSLLLKEWARNGTIALGHFYLRRLLRLYPALVALLVGYLVWVALITAFGSTPQPDLVRRALWGTMFAALHSVNLAAATGDNVPPALTHLWSLDTLEQFYLLWPPLLLVLLRRGATTRRLIGVGVAVIGLVILNRIRLVLGGAPIPRVYFGPDSNIDVVFVGCIAGIAFAEDSLPRLLRRPLPRNLLTGAAVATLGVTILHVEIVDRWLYLGPLTLVGVAATALVVCAVLDPASLLSRTLSIRPLVYLGTISYGIYLWQQVIVFAIARFPPVVEVGLSILMGALSWHMIERRFMRLRRRDRERIDSRADGIDHGPAPPLRGHDAARPGADGGGDGIGSAIAVTAEGSPAAHGSEPPEATRP